MQCWPFDVVGAWPPQEIMARDGDRTGINVSGYVADPTPYLQRAALMVVPLRAGGGMRVKILNAMAQGIPIVSTTLGCEGIEVTPDQHTYCLPASRRSVSESIVRCTFTKRRFVGNMCHVADAPYFFMRRRTQVCGFQEAK